MNPAEAEQAWWNHKDHCDACAVWETKEIGVGPEPCADGLRLFVSVQNARGVEKLAAIGRRHGVKSVTLKVGRRCPTCGEFPPEFRGELGRRVNQLWPDPNVGRHFSAHADGTPFEYTPVGPQTAGLYPVVIVPTYLIGRVVQIRPVEGE